MASAGEDAWDGAYALAAVLTGAYVLSYADRQFLAVALASIQRELALGEVALGLLSGPAFALCYSLLGVPIGMIGDRGHRLRIIAGCVLLWSAATIGCGLARDFGELFAARMLVGAGEAGLLPLAYSLLGQRFPAHRLPQMVGIFIAGGALGNGAAVLFGGPLLDVLPDAGGLASWRLVFVGLGLAGLPVAALLLALREPPRDGRRSAAAAGEAPRFAAFLRGVPHLLLLAAGACLVNVMFYGLHAWVPAFFQRVHGWSPTRIGVTYGTALLLCGVAAAPLWGWLGGRVIARGGDVIRTMVLAAVVPLAVVLPLGALAPDPWIAVAAFGGAPLLMGALVTLVPALIAASTPAGLRARVMAAFFLAANLVGIGGGPVAYAWLNGLGRWNPAGIAGSIAILSPALLLPCGALFLAASVLMRRADARLQLVGKTA